MIHDAFLKQDYIGDNHKSGKLVGVWSNPYKGAPKQGDEAALYDKLFGKSGETVNFYYSDYYQSAMKARDKI